jgi:hypothetical protein
MRFWRLAIATIFAAAHAWPAAANNAQDLYARCVAISQAPHGATPGSTFKQLAPHQLRKRKLCAEWRDLAVSTTPDKSIAAAALAERCLREVRFDLARANEPAFERHVQAGIQMCRDFQAQVSKAR